MANIQREHFVNSEASPNLLRARCGPESDLKSFLPGPNRVKMDSEAGPGFWVRGGGGRGGSGWDGPAGRSSRNSYLSLDRLGVKVVYGLSFWGQRKHISNIRQNISGKCWDSPGIITRQARKNVVYVFLLRMLHSPPLR